MSVKQVNLINKQNFRKFAKLKLKKDIKIKAKCSHYIILQRLEKLIKITNSKKILFFMPLDHEPNLLILRRKFARNHRVFIPFMLDVSFEMVKLKGPFKISNFKVRESCGQNYKFEKIDMAVVPVIGVDGNMARIGHGKGYYDIFFDKLKYRPIIVFMQIKDLFSKEIISQKHDIRCDFYITPRKNYLIRGKYDRDYCRIRSRCGGNWCRVFGGKKDK